MKKLLLLLLLSLFSTQSLAKVGDVYYCIMSKHIKVTESGIEELELERFKIKVKEFGMLNSLQKPAFDFHWGEGDNGMGYTIFNLDYKLFIDVETYTGSSTITSGNTIYYLNGDFYFSEVRPPFIRTVIADCEIF